MAMHYGILRGRVDRFVREDDFDAPHLQIRVVDGNGGVWRVPVNVLSKDGSLLVFHRVDPLVSHPILAGLAQLRAGFTPLAANARSATTALDYFRAPLFGWPTGVEAPHTGPGHNDDLQDAIITYLEQVRARDCELFAFGEPFPEPGRPPNPRPIDRELGTRQGVHNIHMNQGNPPGPFAGDNGVFQDGGVILRLATRHVGLFLRFQSQHLPSDNRTGNRLPTARPIPPGGDIGGTGGDGTTGGGRKEPPLVTHPAVYVERALVNPAGDDPRKEVVVLGNTTTAPADLTGWSIVDTNERAERLTGVVLPPGGSRAIVLSGAAAQLGNRGGTIRLRDAAGVQVHAVSYSETDARVEDRLIRFNT